MSLVVRRTADSYFDDGVARDAVARYCVQCGLEYKFGDRYDPIDMFAYRPTDGQHIGLELTCNACWTVQSEYPEPYIHIPKRKWDTFYKQVHDVPTANINRADIAYLVVLNVPCTRAATLKFSVLLEPIEPFKEEILDINGKKDLFVWVPTSYINRYIVIPPAPKVIKV